MNLYPPRLPVPLRWTATAMLVVLAARLATRERLVAAEASRRPNIIVILADDMGFSDLGCYGGEIETPHLDALAANGLRFTQFYNASRCCPTRASLLTGLYPHQAGMGDMLQRTPFPGYQGDLSPATATIAEVLRDSGYGTYACGKWHLTPAPNSPKNLDRRNWPLQRGFQRFFGTIAGGGSYFDPATLTRNNQLIVPPAFDEFYYTDAVSDAAVDFIKDHDESPFFMYVAYTSAHWPMHAKPADIAKYDGKYDEGWERVREARRQRLKDLGILGAEAELSPCHRPWSEEGDQRWYADRMEVYAAIVDSMDQGIGRIVAELKERGKLDDTLILFLQDNGASSENMKTIDEPSTVRASQPKARPLSASQLQFALVPAFTRAGREVRIGRSVTPGPADTYAAYGIEWANVSNTPFRDYKKSTYEGGIATPLIAHWPRQITRAGDLERQPSHLIDVMATCVEVAQASYPESRDGMAIPAMEGVSLLPAFAGQNLQRRRPLCWEHEGNRAIRADDWKLVAKHKQQDWELYNLREDRSELRDLAGDHPEKVRDLADAWQAWAQRAQVLPLTPYWRRK